MVNCGLASIDDRMFQESSDVRSVAHNAVAHDRWTCAWLGNGPREICSRHSAYLAFSIEYRSATHAREAWILDDIAIVCPTVDDGLCGVDDKGGLPVAPHVSDGGLADLIRRLSVIVHR